MKVHFMLEKCIEYEYYDVHTQTDGGGGGEKESLVPDG